jgi:hypothetical protein
MEKVTMSFRRMRFVVHLAGFGEFVTTYKIIA